MKQAKAKGASEALQSFKELVDISKRPSLFLIYFLIFLIAVTFIVFAGVGAHIWYSYHEQRAILERNLHLISLSNKIALLDEIMTSSARLTAASQDLGWEKRFREYESQQDASIRAIGHLIDDVMLNQDTAQLERTDGEMVKMENQAFQLARQGLFQEASNLLMGEQYTARKNDFNRSLEHISGVMERDAEKNLHTLKHWVIFTGSALCYVGLMLIAVWFLIIHRLRRYLGDRDILETALRQERDKAQMLLDTAGVILIVIDEDERIAMINQRGCEILGYSKEELIGKNWFDMFVPEAVVSNMKKIFHRILSQEEGLFGYYENPIVTKTREVRIIGWNNRIIRDASGHVVGTISSGEDVTKRKSSEESSRRLSTMYQTLFNVNRTILRIRTSQELFNEVCRVAVETGGFRMAWVGLLNSATKNVKPAARFGVGVEILEKFTVSAEDEQEHQGIAGRAIRESRYQVANDIATDIRLLMFRDDLLAAGHRSSAAFPIWQGGNVIGAFVFFAGQTDYFTPDQIELLQELSADISFALDFMDQQHKRSQAEEALKESEYFFRESQRAAFVGSYKLDFTTGVWESSEVLDRIFGIGQSYDRNVQGWLEIVHPDERETMDRYLREEVVSQRHSFNKEYRIIRKSDGETRWLHGLGQVGFNSEGRVISMTGTIQDITERKNSETQLQTALRDWQITFDATHDAVMILGKDFKIIKVNRAMTELLHKSPSEIVDQSCYPMVHGTQDPHEQCPLQKMFQSKKYEESEIYLAQLKIWAWVTASPIFGPTGEIEMAVHTIRNITERKKLEETLWRGDERYEILAYQTGHLVYDYDVKTGAIDWAGAVEEVIGFTQTEADQMINVARWEEMIHPEDRSKTMEVFNEAERAVGKLNTKYRFQHKNGNYVWIEEDGVFLRDKNGVCCRMLGVMKAGSE